MNKVGVVGVEEVGVGRIGRSGRVEGLSCLLASILHFLMP